MTLHVSQESTWIIIFVSKTLRPTHLLNYLRQRTAGPVSTGGFAAGGFSRTRCGFVTLAVIGQ